MEHEAAVAKFEGVDLKRLTLDELKELMAAVILVRDDLEAIDAQLRSALTANR